MPGIIRIGYIQPMAPPTTTRDRQASVLKMTSSYVIRPVWAGPADGWLYRFCSCWLVSCVCPASAVEPVAADPAGEPRNTFGLLKTGFPPIAILLSSIVRG